MAHHCNTRTPRHHFFWCTHPTSPERLQTPCKASILRQDSHPFSLCVSFENLVASYSCLRACLILPVAPADFRTPFGPISPGGPFSARFPSSNLFLSSLFFPQLCSLSIFLTFAFNLTSQLPPSITTLPSQPHSQWPPVSLLPVWLPRWPPRLLALPSEPTLLLLPSAPSPVSTNRERKNFSGLNQLKEHEQCRASRKPIDEPNRLTI